MVLAVVVAFLDECEYLPRLLASIADQTRPPDRLVLVDDGSTDGSFALAEAFAETHPYALAVRRPPRPPETDRLASAAELRAFEWGLERVDVPYDIVAKLDADLELRRTHFAEIQSHFERDADLGVTGGYLSVRHTDGSLVRERHPPDHVRGPNKFYRRACFEQIWPWPAHLGWDTIDELKARMHGWRTGSVELSGGDSIHLRPTGLHDGRLRAFWRWGECAYGFGSHPLYVLAGAGARSRRRPYVLSGVAYALGFAHAHLRRRPRADPAIRAFRRREERRRATNALARARRGGSRA
jgi:biofilm PGA synthesis N-glycosyltransferase PgaC